MVNARTTDVLSSKYVYKTDEYAKHIGGDRGGQLRGCVLQGQLTRGGRGQGGLEGGVGPGEGVFG